MENLALTLSMAVVFLLYVLIISGRFGALHSISESSYKLKGNARFLFFGWLGALALLNVFQDMSFYGCLASIGFTWAGLTLNHKKSDLLYDEIHTAGVILAIVATFSGLIILHSIWVPAVLALLGSVALYKYTRKYIWWIECWVMFNITFGYLMR